MILAKLGRRLNVDFNAEFITLHYKAGAGRRDILNFAPLPVIGRFTTNTNIRLCIYTHVYLSSVIIRNKEKTLHQVRNQ